MSLIILDTLRRILFHEGRPIDWAMLVVEVLVLALILIEFVWKLQERSTDRRDFTEAISGLSPEEADSLMNWALTGQPPNDHSVVRAIAARGFTELREFGGILITKDSKYPLLKRWAKRRMKQQRIR